MATIITSFLLRMPQRILVEAWGNPPEAATNVLGMVFPKGRSFNDGTSWGVVLENEDTGHISDKDASSQDYDSVLSDMKSSAEEENEARKQQGYPESHIVGWAQAPTYDAQKQDPDLGARHQVRGC